MSNLISLPSLELRWLKAPKWISFPAIVIVPVNGLYSGCYWKPRKGEIFLDDKYYDGSKGIIILADGSPATLAHEFRHHWQDSIGIKNDSLQWTNPIDYKAAIINYFRKSKCEYDALLYELKHYPYDVNLQTYEWLQ